MHFKIVFYSILAIRNGASLFGGKYISNNIYIFKDFSQNKQNENYRFDELRKRS